MERLGKDLGDWKGKVRTKSLQQRTTTFPQECLYTNSPITSLFQRKGSVTARKKTLHLLRRPQASGSAPRRVLGFRTQVRESLPKKASKTLVWPIHSSFGTTPSYEKPRGPGPRPVKHPKVSSTPTHLSASSSLRSSQDPKPLKRLHVQTQTASGAQLQQQIAPGDERQQPISAETVGGVPPLPEARMFPICSCLGL